MGLYYKVPEDFEQLVYLGLVLQGQGMRHGMEAHRRNRPYCMGTLYWQLNDSWPVVSWSSIDYYGNWKAMHYQAKRAFAPVLVDAIKEGDDLNIYVMSDKLEADKDVTLQLRLMDFDGKVLKKKEIGADGEISIDWINDSLITFVKDRLGHDQRYAIDPTKITNELGWTPETCFEVGIVKTIRWYLENQKWVEDITGGDYMKYYEQMYGSR